MHAASGKMLVACDKRNLPVRPRAICWKRESRDSLMSVATRSLLLVLCSLVTSAAGARGADEKLYNGPACGRNLDEYFAKEVWAKVGATLCVQCHKAGGD